MSTYDPDDWLVSAYRTLQAYVLATFDPELVTVEMNFPNTQEALPLPKTLIHFERDAMDNPVIGFGTPGDEVYTPAVGANPATYMHRGAALHLLNFDMGVWASKESGGATHRMRVTQKLVDLFHPADARLAFREATGMSVVSFDGGRDELDRIADVPVWRTIDMTLVIRVVSRHTATVADIEIEKSYQDQELTIVTDNTGAQTPVT